MKFEYTDEQTALAEVSRQIFESLTPDALRALQDSGHAVHSNDLWERIAAAGLVGISLDESVGGGGGTLFDLGIVFFEAGRALAPTTFGSTVFAALLIDRLGSPEQRAQSLPRLCTGSIGTVAVAETGNDLDLSRLSVTADQSPSGWVLNGTKVFVQNGADADVLVVAAACGEPTDAESGMAFFIVDGGSSGLTAIRQSVIGEDGQATVHLADVEVSDDARLASTGVTTDEAFDAVFSSVSALHAVEMAGGAEKVLDLAARYVTTREQFGRPIGSFQALQHIIANVGMAITSGRWLAFFALWRASEELAAATEASAANAVMSKAYVDATLWAHQVHGGIGFARESNLYLWSQRAKAMELQWGSRRQHLERVASGLFGEDPTARYRIR